MLYKTPTKEELEAVAPWSIWEEAIKQALRSDHKRHRTGCVIFSGKQVYARGCSHTHNGGLKVRSVHAEHDALNNYHNRPASRYHSAIVVTLTKSKGFATISKPCSGCAKLLDGEVFNVIFAERANDESWTVLSMKPSLLENLTKTRYGNS